MSWIGKWLGGVSNSDIEVRSWSLECMYGAWNEDNPFDILELYVK